MGTGCQAGKLPGSLRLWVTRCTRDQQHPQTPAWCWPCCGVALPVLAPEKVFGLHTPSRGSCMCLRGAPRHCPSPAVPCEVLGDGDVLVSCHVVTERWHRAVCGSGRSLLQRAGWRVLWPGGAPAGRSWPCRGAWVGGDLPARPHVAPGGGRAMSRPAVVAGTSLPCPGRGAVASGDSVGARGSSPQSL